MAGGEKEVKKPRGYQAGLAVCFAIIVVLGYWGYTLLNQVNSLNADKTNLQSQVNSLTSDKTNLQNQVNSLISQINTYSAWLSGNKTMYQNYVATHSYSNSEYDALKAPKLILVNMKSDDNRPWLQTPYLHVYGEVCNVGTNTAYNCKLHVVAYQSGGVVAIDTYIVLGTINGKSWVTVDSKIYYSGSALTGWSITPEWTS